MEQTKSSRDSVQWLAFLHAPGLSYKTRYQLINRFKAPAGILAAESPVLSEFSIRQETVDFLKNPSGEKIESDYHWLQQPANHLVTLFDPGYPQLLKQIHDPPLALYVRGDPRVLNHLQMSIVGSRNPTPDGRRLARDFAGQLVQRGFVITSGLASGLDSYAHLGALEASGKTIAVLGSGLNVIYPAKHEKLAGMIVENGALVSEFSPDIKPLAENFPRRNRIISGLSTGTLIVEAAIKSGTLITARFAMEQGREVFAIPGSIYSPVSRGCHELIREGAKLVDKIEDVLEEIGPLAAVVNDAGHECNDNDKRQEGLDEQAKLLLDNIGRQPVTVDYLIEQTGLVTSAVSSLLLDLELRGLVESVIGGKYIRI